MAKKNHDGRPPALSQDGAHAGSGLDRAAFQQAGAAFYEGLLDAARSEIGYRVGQGDLPPDGMTPAELVDEALVLAWRNRRRRLEPLSIRAWFLVMLFRAMEDSVARNGKFGSVSLSVQDPEPTGLCEDDESFWEWNQPAEEPGRERRATRPMTPRAARLSPAAIADMARTLDADAHQAFVLHEIFRLPLRAVARALETTPADAERLLTKARRHAGTLPQGEAR